MTDRWSRLSLRTRMVLLATVTVTAVLTTATVTLGAVLRNSLVDGVTQGAVVRAHELAGLVTAGAIPDPVPVTEDDALVQIVGSDGAIIAASRTMPRLPALDLSPGPPGDVRVHDLAALPGGDDRARVAATTAETADGPVTIFVAASLDDVADLLAAAGGLAAVAIPALVLVLSAAMWFVVGRTLAPVAAITDMAAGIGGNDLHRRVPEPGHEDEVARLARTLNRMLARLQDANQRHRRFVADAAHELRSPIASLRTQLETARDATGSVDWSRMSGELLADTVRIQTLTEQLLVLARLDSDGFTLRTQAVDLDDVVDRAIRQTLSGADLHADLEELQPAQVVGDAVLLEQAVTNLVENAARHARRRMKVTTRITNDTGVLIVEDDGLGVPPEHRQTILRPFTRLDPARSRSDGGAGLGLAIVHDVVSAHGGVVTVDASPLGGARFRIDVPRATAPPDRTGADRSAADQP